MKLGWNPIPRENSGLDPVGVLKLAKELGWGVLFELSPFQSFGHDSS